MKKHTLYPELSNKKYKRLYYVNGKWITIKVSEKEEYNILSNYENLVNALSHAINCLEDVDYNQKEIFMLKQTLQKVSE